MNTHGNPMAAIALAVMLGGTLTAFAQDRESTMDDAEADALRAELAEVRAELAEAARRMAEIQRRLVAEPAMAKLEALDSELAGVDIERIRIESSEALQDLGDMPPRLGVLLESGDDGEATRVLGVTPGSGAERAGIRAGDIILSVAGTKVENRGGAAIREALRDVEAGETVEVVVRRGENGEEERALGVKTSSVRGDIRLVFERLGDLPEIAEHVSVIGLDGASAPRPPHSFGPPRLSVLGPDTDLVSNHAGLEPYFGTGEGVIALRVDDDNPMQLRDGDVILTLDRVGVESPVELARQLLRRDAGDTVALEVMREGVLTELRATIPDRPSPTGPLGQIRIDTPRAPATAGGPQTPPRRY